MFITDKLGTDGWDSCPLHTLAPAQHAYPQAIDSTYSDKQSIKAKYFRQALSLSVSTVHLKMVLQLLGKIPLYFNFNMSTEFLKIFWLCTNNKSILYIFPVGNLRLGVFSREIKSKPCFQTLNLNLFLMWFMPCNCVHIFTLVWLN